MRVRHIFISPGHNFFGRHGQAAGTHPVVALDAVDCVAGRGLRGDRFFDYRPDYKGQVTFFSWEVYVELWEELGVSPEHRDPAATRRNIIVEGVNLNALIGQPFAIQGIRFLGTEECKPCYWMNGVIHPQAEAWLRGRGGLRAKILDDGTLRCNAV